MSPVEATAAHDTDSFAPRSLFDGEFGLMDSGVAVLPMHEWHTPAPFRVDPATAWRQSSVPAPSELHVREGGNRGVLYQAAKRAMDAAGALVALFLFAPFMLTAFFVLSITTRGHAIFSQERVGEGGRKFRMYKFRTMRMDAEQVKHLVANESNGPIFKNRCDPRVTRFGRFLRSFSIDEMPQLFNVLRGDMSLVGPRPLPTAEALKCKGRALRRYSVKPGLTCLWQVSGRSDIGFDGLVKRDLWYVRRQSLATDLKLLLRTPLTVLSRRGAY